MHSSVNASEVNQHTEQPGRTQGHRVQHPHLNVGMTINRKQDGVGGCGAEIVEQ